MLCLVGEKLFSEELIDKAVQRIRPKLPQAAVIKSDGGERCASIRARFGVPTFSVKIIETGTDNPNASCSGLGQKSPLSQR